MLQRQNINNLSGRKRWAMRCFKYLWCYRFLNRIIFSRHLKQSHLEEGTQQLLTGAKQQNSLEGELENERLHN